MNIDAQLIDSALRERKLNTDRIDDFFRPLAQEQLEKQIARGFTVWRSRRRFLWKRPVTTATLCASFFISKCTMTVTKGTNYDKN